jgi:hypothetical protein
VAERRHDVDDVARLQRSLAQSRTTRRALLDRDAQRSSATAEQIEYERRTSAPPTSRAA